MADTTTTNYAFVLPEPGASEDTWGAKLNQNWNDLDSDLKTIADAVAANTSAVENIELFQVGTAMLFAQTTAPTGWTKSTTHNDKALRVVSGTASSGGTTAFTTAFGTPAVTGTVGINGAPAVGNLAVSVSGNIAVGDTTLSINQIPSHSHTYYASNDSSPNGGNNLCGRGTNGVNITSDNSTDAGFNTASSGGSGSHNHSANHNLSGNLTGAPGSGNLAGSLSSATASINVQYVDVIIATKD